MDDLLFYDIEVFKYDSLVVFKNIDNQVVRYFWNRRPQTKFVEDEPKGFEGIRSLIKGKTLVGYNNYYYDDIILSLMLRGSTQDKIKKANDELIAGSYYCELDDDIKSLDTMQQIDVSKPSLKLIEGNMGKSIIESKIDFTIDRPLTDEEKEEVLKYCCYDVETTIDVYKLRKDSYFDTKAELINMLGDESMYRYNTTTIVAKLLMPNGFKQKWRSIRIENRKEDLIPPSVWNLWDSWSASRSSDSKKTSLKKNLLDCEFVFGFGGLHGVNLYNKSFKNVILLDVGSMYPSIIILLKGLEDSTQKYDDIRKERLSIKHTDPVKAGALKLILNSTYGLLKNQYSTLFNPYASTTICIFGQIALYDLCVRLYESGYQLINMNTDGVAFNKNKEVLKDYHEIWHEWEADYGLTLEADYFDTWYQKDVNNYIATHDGKIKVKGGDVNKYQKEKLFSNNNIRIVQIALVEKLVNDIDPIVTIMKHLNEPQLFQYVLRAGHTYKGVYDKDLNKYQNVNRVFAYKDEYKDECTKLYKMREDEGLVNFPDTPDNMFIWNDDVKNIDVEEFKKKVDKNFYYNLIYKKLDDWR